MFCEICGSEEVVEHGAGYDPEIGSFEVAFCAEHATTDDEIECLRAEAQLEVEAIRQLDQAEGRV